MSSLRKNQFKSVIYHVLVAIITYLFMISKYVYDVMPNSVAIFLLLFISLGMTIEYSDKPHERAASVGLPILINTALFFVGLIGANGFPNANIGADSMYWIPVHILNPNLTFMPYFIDKANMLVKYLLIIITPSFLLYVGMLLGHKTRQKLYNRVNDMSFSLNRKNDKK